MNIETDFSGAASARDAAVATVQQSDGPTGFSLKTSRLGPASPSDGAQPCSARSFRGAADSVPMPDQAAGENKPSLVVEPEIRAFYEHLGSGLPRDFVLTEERDAIVH
ncbi:hypothetical protein [Paracoccus endophyticus]|uniref:hypothetical protein n=1 Tax=Paracoccus endophyticus TaxID=2233774 RepID=UPI000DDA0DFE|nr:hypothetical protein [Paracoccus endophyticus]